MSKKLPAPVPKRGRGRSPIAPELRRTKWIGAAVTETEKATFHARAVRATMEESSFLRKIAGIDAQS